MQLPTSSSGDLRAASRPEQDKLLHVLIPPAERSRDLLTTITALNASRDPRLHITTCAPGDWRNTPEAIRRSVVDRNTTVHEGGGFDDPVSGLDLADGEALFLIQAGAIPPRGWMETLLAHGRQVPGARAVGATPHISTEDTSESLDRWSENDERAHSNWYRLFEDRASVDTPLLALFNPTECSRQLRDWWRSGAHGSLRLPAGGRLLLAKDIQVLSPASKGDSEAATTSPSIRSCMRDPRIEPNRLTDCIEDIDAQRMRLLEVLEDGPHPEASLYLTRLGLATGRREEAAGHARACLDSWPNCSEAQLLLARALTGLGRIDAALSILETLQQGGPMNKELHGGLFACLGSIWLRKGEPHQAGQCIEEALLLEPGNPVALYGRARLHLAHGRFEDALADLLATTRETPLIPDAWFELGRTHILAGDYQAGRIALLHLLDLAPDHDAARGLLERTDPDVYPHLPSDLPGSY
ncbi:MAG: tetratricopeptide repeat protein [Planctomycetota bacterium]|nr:tetratricopeptide repeat protein [Planctomycetota bacterium]